VTTGETERTRAGPIWLPVFVVAYVVLGLRGRATIIDGTELATIWPAAGVAVLWLMVRRAAPLSLDTALLAGTSFLVNWLTGAPLWLALLLTTTNIAQTLVVVALMRRTLPPRTTAGAIDAPRRLARYLASVGIGVLAGTALGIVGLGVAGQPVSLLDASLWFGRNVCGILVLTTVGLLLVQYFSEPHPRPKLWRGTRWEFGAACLVSGALYVTVFVIEVDSMLFLLLGVVIWFGVRFGTLTNALHTLVAGNLAVAATLAGMGPFTHESPQENALLVQLFLITTACVGLALSTSLDEREALVNELRKSTDEATDQAQLLNAVVNSMAEGLIVVDDSGRWLLRNPAASRVGGLADDLRALMSSSEGEPDPLTLALTGETVRDRELEVVGPKGQGRILAVSSTPLPPDPATGRARALLIFRDATIEHARRVDLTAFADVVAHDLRNPLAAVESWTEMMAAELAEGEVEPELVHRYVERVGVSSRRMNDLIDDLLDRATNSTSALQLRRVDVGALAEEVATDHDAAAQVTVGEIPAVHADPALVRQVVDNLLGNALKFVRDGTEPKVSVTGRKTGSGTVAISVSDEGIGLPPGAHDQVFEERHRAHSTYDGRGLGLAICRRIVERHGGSISARDNAPDGAVFEFTLPAPD
jgi:signal transduction histidine kinase